MTDLPPRNSWDRRLAEIIWRGIQPPNPHGPQDDLSFEMVYVRDYAERATRIAKLVRDAGWVPPLDPTTKNDAVTSIIASTSGHVTGEGIRVTATELERILGLAYTYGRTGFAEPITVESLEHADPFLIEPAQDIVALVSGINNQTVDMTIVQALDLHLMLSIKGHQSDLYLATGEELWLRCTCGKFDVHVSADSIEDLADQFVVHLKSIVQAPKLSDLPDGSYFDGTYEWVKDGNDWTPLLAPSGMPSKPDITRLKRVVKTYKEI